MSENLPVAAVQAFGFSSKKKKGDFLSTDTDEIYRVRNLMAKDWEGFVYGWAPQRQIAGTVPIYRYFCPKTQDHLLTTSEEEGNLAIKYLGYQSEGAACLLFSTPQAAAPWMHQGEWAIPIGRWLCGTFHFYSTGRHNEYSGPWQPSAPQGLKNPKLEATLGYLIPSEYPAPTF